MNPYCGHRVLSLDDPLWVISLIVPSKGSGNTQRFLRLQKLKMHVSAKCYEPLRLKRPCIISVKEKDMLLMHYQILKSGMKRNLRCRGQ